MNILHRPSDATETVAVNATSQGLGKPVQHRFERKDYASVRDAFNNALTAAEAMRKAGYAVNVTARTKGAPWTLLATGRPC